jgi:hypothetical protein
VADILGVGKAIGVKFNDDKSNMFNLLSRAARKNNEGGGACKEGRRKLCGDGGCEVWRWSRSVQ